MLIRRMMHSLQITTIRAERAVLQILRVRAMMAIHQS